MLPAPDPTALAPSLLHPPLELKIIDSCVRATLTQMMSHPHALEEQALARGGAAGEAAGPQAGAERGTPAPPAPGGMAGPRLVRPGCRGSTPRGPDQLLPPPDPASGSVGRPSRRQGLRPSGPAEDGEVLRLGVVHHQGRRALLGDELHRLGQRHPDLLRRREQPEQLGLVRQVRAGGVAPGVALALAGARSAAARGRGRGRTPPSPPPSARRPRAPPAPGCTARPGAGARRTRWRASPAVTTWKATTSTCPLSSGRK